MADEEPPEDEVPDEAGIDADDEVFDGEVAEVFEADDDELATVVVDAEDDDEDDVATPARPVVDEEEDEDDDEVEADLDAILKDRIAAGDDDDDEDDDEDGKPPRPAPAPAGEAEPVVARQDHEISCPNCFLLVNTASVVDGECPHCGGPVEVP